MLKEISIFNKKTNECDMTFSADFWKTEDHIVKFYNSDFKEGKEPVAFCDDRECSFKVCR